jgi:hypothetical protein
MPCRGVTPPPILRCAPVRLGVLVGARLAKACARGVPAHPSGETENGDVSRGLGRGRDLSRGVAVSESCEGSGEAENDDVSLGLGRGGVLSRGVLCA